MSDISDFENIIYLHICNNQRLFKSVHKDYFKNKLVSSLFDITKKFFEAYANIPFSLDYPEIEQIKELVVQEPDTVYIDRSLDKETNIQNFLINAKNIISSNYKRYERDWLVKNIEQAWIPWEAQERGFREALAFRRSQGNLKPDQIKTVIDKCFDIIQSSSTMIIDDDTSYDFYDAEAHKPTPLNNLIDSGFPKMNLWASGNENGGFKPGTLTILAGEANIGKCEHKSTIITLKNKKTGEVCEISIGDFYKLIKDSKENQ